MTGASFYKPGEGKCPNCGEFGENMSDEEGKVCPNCSTVFNNYMVLQKGEKVEFRNH
ncbi:MAG: hypothetical protein MUP58_00380 [Candidatus Nanohaloarchaeota archaeon QJJ-9]|nr:hypothetical protein [Candidatus Nanohaloarchaeota archaeon QJJ-9]